MNRTERRLFSVRGPWRPHRPSLLLFSFHGQHSEGGRCGGLFLCLFFGGWGGVGVAGGMGVEG